VRDLEQWDDAALLADSVAPAASYAAFYGRYVQTVLRYCARQGLDATDAADLTAETFAAAFLARRRYRADLGAASSWLLGIAKNRLADNRRRFARERSAQRRLAMEPIELSERDFLEFEAIRNEEAAIADAIADLPEDQRMAIQARLVAGETYRQMAHQLGISEPAARQRVSRGLARLRHRLEER
jgi:RNA polymerase sigma factor (sigma-70 family)